MWTLLLQSVLISKSEVYSSMSVEESSQYQRVKSTILKAPEAYRQYFRSSQKKESQTYTKFAREKEVQFDRWCSVKEIAQDLNRLHQLILLEEFKSCLPPLVKTYLDELRVENLSQAAVLANDYSLTHKNTFTKHRLEPAGGQTSTSDRLTPATSETTYTGAHVLIQGVEIGVLCVPLHKVSLESDLISGPVVVGVRPTLPIQGVSLIPGNDLAGGKVIPDVQVVNEQESMKEGAELDDKMSDVFPACAITRAMGKSTGNKDSGKLW